jgi:cob(I)alamin adenosyltransferase
MGLVYLYTGTGPGKTTNALGLALRALGHNLRVVIVQFMKGRKEIGEWKIKEKLDKIGLKYEIYQFGRPEFINLKQPAPIDKKLAKKGLQFAEKIMKTAPDLLILDEINLAVAIHLLSPKDVLRLLSKIPKKTTVVLTGRYAPYELEWRADFVNEIVDKKRPKKMPLIKGIQY